MLDPRSLYTVHDDIPDAVQTHLVGPAGRQSPLALVHTLDGFVNAGSAATLVGRHLLDTLEHHPVATFEVDELFDYRSRRPTMFYDRDHYASYDAPSLVLYAVQDHGGRVFLLLTGPEPDVQWERFVAALRQLIERFGVDVTVGLHGIGMAVPHTRPTGVLGHATRAELVPAGDRWSGRVQIPSSAAALLEFRLGQWGHDALGFVVQVPHYLAETPYPDAALVLLDRLSDVAQLTAPRQALVDAAERTREMVSTQVSGSPEVAQVVEALEQQYDATVRSGARPGLLPSADAELPSADELGAEVERFLAGEAGVAESLDDPEPENSDE
ncbi:MAG: proteasome assembly chaperone family protein [Angustibacter sp.]